jgi:hypothetical protein
MYLDLKEEVTEGWKKLYNGEHYDLYFSPVIVRVIKLRKMKWVFHVTQIG